MHPNHLYLLHWARGVAAAVPGARILDYGCGAGEVVVEGRRQGLDISGADVFYEGGSSKREIEALGLLGNVVTEIRNGRLEYPNETFDLVLSNQVIEHAADLDAVLAEIRRVMRPHSKLVCLFPTKEVIREGHIGIPFIHWFAKESRRRHAYALACRALGFGYFKGDKSARQWAADALDWIDKYTFYRTRCDTVDVFREHFAVTMIEPDYVRFRLRHLLHLDNSTLLARIFGSFVVPGLARRLLHRLHGVVLLAERAGLEDVEPNVDDRH